MSFDKTKLITKLMELKQDLFNMVEKKYGQIENLQEDIRYLEQRMREIDQLIGIDNIMDAETFLEHTKEDQIENIEESRTIFSSSDSTHPLIKMKYDGRQLDIRIVDAEKVHLKQQSSAYIERVLQPLFPLKEKEKDMELVVDKQNDLGFITRLLINNLYKMENIDTVFKVFQDLVKHS